MVLRHRFDLLVKSIYRPVILDVSIIVELHVEINYTKTDIRKFKEANMYYIGVDIGSSSAKVAVLDEGAALCHTLLRATGWDSVGTAGHLAAELASIGIDTTKNPVVATGYGRKAVDYAARTVTEITCHGRGAAWIFGPEQATVIDIGGQDSKIINIENGQVKDFSMNDKCSAGTGRFLEVMAGALGVSIPQLCELADLGRGVQISSMCTVFAESEVVGLIGAGTPAEDIAHGIIDSIVTRIASQATRLLLPDAKVYLTGGLCENDYIILSLGAKLNRSIISDARARYAGAIGAALQAAER